MKIIVGLGNPDPKYVKTRHNIGHLMIDWLGEINNCILIKTDTYMNQSGSFVKEVLKKYNLTPNDLVIVHDDWAFDVGVFKLQFNRNHNRHNGVIDIIEKLQTKAFWRIRVGIGACRIEQESSDYVLTKFSKDELLILQNLCQSIKESIKSMN